MTLPDPGLASAVSLLRLEGISAGIRLPSGENRTILEHLDLTVGEGQTLAIVGGSGSGKSTLLSLLGLMLPPCRGQFYLAGKDVRRLPEHAAARLRNEQFGFVFQNGALIGDLSVSENVELPLRYGKSRPASVRREAASAALRSVGLGGREDARPRALSGGEQQRVAVARAIVRRPPILLADEPTGSLDRSTSDEVIGLLQGHVQRSHSCLIVVTHDPTVASRMQRCLRLETGRLLECEPGKSGEWIS